MHDIIIIGGGPAGLAAALYCARYKLKTLVLIKQFGGQISESYRVENYPGISSASGFEIISKFAEQAKHFGAEIIEEEVVDVKKGFEVKTNKKTYKSRFLIIAQGGEHKKLNISGEKKLAGKGVSYCASCDAAFFKDKIVGVVGGANSAVVSAILCSQYAKKVYIFYRGKALRADPVWIDEAKKIKKINVLCNVNIAKINGKDFLESVELDNKKNIKLHGLFIEIGTTPNTHLAEKLGIKLNKEHFIVVDERQKTNLDKVYAIGDITTNSNKFKQVITAAAEGAVAANAVFENLKK